jgi:hypothetical protein
VGHQGVHHVRHVVGVLGAEEVERAAALVDHWVVPSGMSTFHTFVPPLVVSTMCGLGFATFGAGVARTLYPAGMRFAHSLPDREHSLAVLAVIVHVDHLPPGGHMDPHPCHTLTG